MRLSGKDVWSALVGSLSRAHFRSTIRCVASEVASFLPVTLKRVFWGPEDRYLPFAGEPGGEGMVPLGVEASAQRTGEVLAPRVINAWLALPAEMVMERSVAVPIAAELDLKSALAYELDRISPVPSEKAWFDFRITRRSTSEGTIAVGIAIGLHEHLRPGVVAAKALGYRLVGVGLASELGRVPQPLNLLPLEERDRRAIPPVAVVGRALATAVGAFLVAAVLYPIWLQRELTISLGPRLARAQAEAAVSEQVAKQIESLSTDFNFIVARRHTQQPMAVFLEDLSRALPDDTWVQQLEVRPPGVKSREVLLGGETGSSSTILSTLESTGRLSNTAFKSPLTKGASAGLERFLVAGELKPLPLPAPTPDRELSVAAPAPQEAKPGPNAAAGDLPAPSPIQGKAKP